MLPHLCRACLGSARRGRRASIVTPPSHTRATPQNTTNTTNKQPRSYAHAEARKSPVVDGRVLRTADGKEVRYPVLLSPQEKEIARIITLAFGQR